MAELPGRLIANKTPEQRLARKIQAETGRKYCDCLREAQARICTEQFPGREPNNSEEK